MPYRPSSSNPVAMPISTVHTVILTFGKMRRSLSSLTSQQYILLKNPDQYLEEIEGESFARSVLINFSSISINTYPTHLHATTSKCLINGITKLLSNLRHDKAAGPDEIRIIVLKELRPEIAPIIQLIFERSLATGEVPFDWTKASVSPIFKKADNSGQANYRPISLACILCKVMEHIIASNLTKHLNKHNMLYDLQHVFRQKRSRETQLIQLVDLGRQLIQGKQTDQLLLDFSKAFDKVNHLKLLFKFSQHGAQRRYTFVLFVLLLYVPSQQLWSWWDGQFT